MRIGSRGQVTIPARIRRELGLLPNTEVEFIVDGDSVRIVRRGTGKELVRQLWGSATVKMSTDEIMALTRGED